MRGRLRGSDVWSLQRTAGENGRDFRSATTPGRTRCEWSLVPPGVNQFDALLEMVAAHACPDSVMLDVGAGYGDREYPTRLKSIVGRTIGVDPSAAIVENEWVDERFQSTLEEFASTHGQLFDLAVVSYVVEHVATPETFLAALHHCLRPGGSAFILTPHVFHYFGAAAFIARRLHVDEWVLRRIREETTIHYYHFPVWYRMNSRGRLTRYARRAGFRHLELRMLDEPGIYQPYFPTRLKRIPAIWSSMVHRLDAPAMAGTMLARLEA